MKKKIMAKYDIILQNNGSKETFVISGVQSTSNSKLYIEFDGLELPKKCKDGEYTYAIIQNSLTGVEYRPKNGLLETIVTYDGEEYLLRDLKPLVGLLRVGILKEKNVYKDEPKNKNYYYQG